MKQVRGTCPEPFEVKIYGNMAKVTFYTNTTEKTLSTSTKQLRGSTEKSSESDTITVYECDSYNLTVKNRNGLVDDITNDYDSWLELAKSNELERLSNSIREKRNTLLAETDSAFCIDRLDLTNLENITTSPMAIYRQKLRDVPEQEGFPYDVVFPTKPNE